MTARPTTTDQGDTEMTGSTMPTADPTTDLTPAQRAMLDALPADAWKTMWGEFRDAYNEFRDRNPGWQAFWTAHHQYALDAALKALATALDLPAHVHRGVAAGRSEAAADLPSTTAEIGAWLSRHGLSTTPGVGPVLAAVRADLTAEGCTDE